MGVLAVVGVFAAVQIVAHPETPHFGVTLIVVLAGSAICLSLTDKETRDAFFAVMAALCSLILVLLPTASTRDRVWWFWALGLVVAAIALVLLTRKKLHTLAAIAVIVGFRLLIGLIHIVF